ncbi:MAG: transglutaminase family protein [Firmicutes bacterium]|nr:transglutaminase family protein [Bacillota bacterium]
MGKLRFEYWMEIAYSEPVTECHYTFKCLPRDTETQRIEELNIEITPPHEHQQGEDSFGNLMIYDNLYCEHDRFGFWMYGVARTGLAEGEPVGADEFVGRYRYPYGLNRAGDGIRAYFAANAPDAGSPRERAVYLMHRLHRDFRYEKGVTNISTTAEQAWRMGCGVCQDYAHILIALCHLAGIPARYVTGMMAGEGYSHAWVEILADGVWYGLDPTNDCPAGEHYIKIGIGRDAEDCLINKGMVTGGGVQTQNVVVRVEEAER